MCSHRNSSRNDTVHLDVLRTHFTTELPTVLAEEPVTVLATAKIVRLSGCNDWIDLRVVERDRTPRQLMELGIRLRLAELSLSNTVRELGNFGVERSRKAVRDRVYKRDLQLAAEANPNHVAVDKTVIQIDDHRY